MNISKGITLTRKYCIGKYWVDGFYKYTNTVYEYMGCHWHGCVCCNDTDRNALIPMRRNESTSYNERYKNTLEKLEFKKKIIMLNVFGNVN